MSDQPSSAAGKRRNWWVWVSAGLALLAAGLLVWALTLRSDLDGARQDNAQLQAQMDQAAQAGGTAVDEAKGLYDDVAQQLGSTSETLAATEQDLEQAKKVAAGATAAAATAGAAAVKARKEAEEADANAAEASKAAEQATSEADKAEAEADKAEAETDKAKAEADEADAERDKAVADAEVVKSRATIAADCAKAYVSAMGALFEGESAKAQAPAVRESLRAITADCKAALGST